MRHIQLPSFKPHPMLPGGHLQTLAGHLSPPPKGNVTAKSHIVDLEDGDKLIIDETPPATNDVKAPLLVIFHGLSGCSMSIYAQHLAAKLSAKGARVLRVNHRGCGASTATSTGIYHAGSFYDVDKVVKALGSRWPQAAIRVAGFSLSGNMVLNWLACEPLAHQLPSQLKGVLAVSPPIQLELCSLALSRLSNAHFDQYFSKRLVKEARARNLLPMDRLPKSKGTRPWFTLRDFDEVLTAPKAGFINRQEYYERCSAYPSLHRINVPTLVLTAKDDPFVPAASFENARWSSSTAFKLIENGGHMGWVSRQKTCFGDHRWLDEAVYTWFFHSPR